jgi:murein DD-endopeptidase MepM/ murein hydrolase activator NlpD
VIPLLISLALSAVPPVPGPVTQHFVAPSCQRCAGHRGITIDNSDGVTVVSPVAGTVTFAGSVAHQLYVVVEPSPGVLVTVGRLALVAVREGDHLAQGQIIGVSGATTYLGVRVRGVYVEPLRFLGFSRARLVGRGAVVGLRAYSR